MPSLDDYKDRWERTSKYDPNCGDPYGRVARTYRLHPGTVKAVDGIAEALDAFPSQVVQVLLDYALDAVSADRIAVNRRPIKYAVEIHRKD